MKTARVLPEGGLEISASGAGGYDNFTKDFWRCPECMEPVILCKGEKRVAYFRHPRYSGRDCSLRIKGRLSSACVNVEGDEVFKGQCLHLFNGKLLYLLSGGTMELNSLEMRRTIERFRRIRESSPEKKADTAINIRAAWSWISKHKETPAWREMAIWIVDFIQGRGFADAIGDLGDDPPTWIVEWAQRYMEGNHLSSYLHKAIFLEVVDYLSKAPGLPILEVVVLKQWGLIECKTQNGLPLPLNIKGRGGLYIVACLFYHLALLPWEAILRSHKETGTVLSMEDQPYIHPNKIEEDWIGLFERRKGFGKKKQQQLITSKRKE